MNAEQQPKNVADKILGWGNKTIRSYLIRFAVIVGVGFVITLAIDLYRLQQPEFRMARKAVLESELVATESGGIRYVERRASESLHEYVAEGKRAMYSFYVRGNTRNLLVQVNLYASSGDEWEIQSLVPKAVENAEVR